MRFCENRPLYYLLAIKITILIASVTSFAQFNVSINGPVTTTMSAPTGQFTVSATVSGNTNPLTKIVFYRNDVPYKTFTGTGTSQVLTENELGQDTYTYRARAYDSQNNWVDSDNIKIIVETPRVFKMGDMIGTTQTHGPDRYRDHSDEIQAAINHIDSLGGGTLYFPCKFPPLPGNPQLKDIAIYNIKKTITIPANVTIQGEGAEEEVGKCRIYWSDTTWNPGAGCHDNPGQLLDKPMFKIEGETSRIRFRDLWLYSRSSGSECWPRPDWDRIDDENTVGILIDAKGSSEIKDIILENVSISNFTYGIKATGNSISDVKMRGVRPNGNYRQLKIDATYAYEWDIQNFNITSMMEDQGAVEIIKAGTPVSYSGEDPKLKFLQLNCNGNTARTAAFCVRVKEHSGLYFKQLHHEGANKAIIVEDIDPATNSEPIIFEHSVATGDFKDASMKLYLVGNNAFAAPEVAQPGLDDGRLRFIGSGVNSTLIECGDVHWDWTDINGGTPAWEDFQMLFTHSERNRESFFAEANGITYPKNSKNCPSGVSGVPDIDEIGGEHFNTGVLPMEAILPYSNVLDTVTCDSSCNAAAKLQELLANGGSVYIKGGFKIDQTVTVPSGGQIIGAPKAELELIVPNKSLFQIDIPQSGSPRLSGIIIRNLKLTTSELSTTGISITGHNSPAPGASSDIHFSGLTIEGFTKGLDAGPSSPTTGQPMIDGISFKNLSFVNNQTGVRVFSGNASNWNIMNLRIDSNTANAFGWHQTYGGNSMQNVECQGSISNDMTHCIKMDMAGIYLTGFKRTSNVINALTFGENGTVFAPPYQARVFANSVLRNNDFSSPVANVARVNLIGKAFIVSMNNKYHYFNAGATYEGDLSRVTHCADSYAGGTPYPGLVTRHTNLYVGVPTLTRVECGTRPKPWENVVNWGGTTGDKPLVGNFFDDVREDLVIYREGAQSQFLIRQSGGTGTITSNWGTTGDKPLIGRFFPNERAQIVIWRPSTGSWWVMNPNTSATYVWGWGISGDIPFTGNFIDESGSVTGDEEEIAIYRPSDKTIWILNPRSGQYVNFARGSDYGTDIQVGDFLGVGYDQIAQYKDGVWSILDARTTLTYTVNLGSSGDVPVAGKYLTGSCTQVGIWNPTNQEFTVADPFPSCGTRTMSTFWGSNNDFGTSSYEDDIPLTINTSDGSLDRPAAYRPTNGAFPYGIAKGEWWIRDPF